MENNRNPQKPGVPGPVAPVSTSPFEDIAPLTAPAHSESAVHIGPDLEAGKPSNVIKPDVSPVEAPAPVVKSGIEVTALRPGLYKQVRRKIGDHFTISKIEHLGSWMKLCDKALEANRQKEIVQAKNKAKLAGK